MIVALPNVVYEPRSTRFSRLMTYQGCDIKVYGVTTGERLNNFALNVSGSDEIRSYGIDFEVTPPRTRLEMPNPATMNSGEQLASEAIDDLRQKEHYGLAFVIIHETPGADFVTFCHWHDFNEYGIRVWIRKREGPLRFQEVIGQTLNICIWDQRIIAFERDAWTRHILANGTGPCPGEYVVLTDGNGPDRQGYLSERLNEDA